MCVCARACVRVCMFHNYSELQLNPCLCVDYLLYGIDVVCTLYVFCHSYG